MGWIFLIVTSTILCGFVEVSKSANILVIMPLPSRSHFKSFEPFWEEMIEKGHNLTIIAGYKLSNQFQSNYTLVDLKPVFSKWNVDLAGTRKQNPLHNLIFIHNACQRFMDEVLQYSDVQDLINSNKEFDLVIAEMFHVDAIFAFGYKFDAPIITVMPQIMPSFYNWILGNPFPSSYIPSPFLPFTEQMSLFARVVNTMYSFLAVLFYEFISLPYTQSQIEKHFHFERENTPHIKEIIKNKSVSLVSAHYSFGYLKPDLPNVVNVAGLHLKSPASLPKDLQKFMDAAEYGVIYLSLGSFIELNKVENLGKEFIRVMENLPQRVVMKWDLSLLPYVPENFFVQDWLPQESILNHPKCRLFITHGGLHSALEAVNASVPLIGIPFFADQHYNLAIAEYYEIGIALQVDDVSQELRLKIEEVLKNPKYKKNMMKRSMIFRDRPNTPLETAMYWIDHVLKYKDTAHLRSASAKLSWYELYSLDVLIILLAIIYVVQKTVKFTIRKIKHKLLSIKKKNFANNKSQKDEKVIKNLKYD